MVKVKICGLTNRADAWAAAQAGADLLGLIFYPKSPRYVAVEQAREIVAAVLERAQAARQAHVETGQQSDSNVPDFVGVFVNETVDQISAIVEHVGLAYVQLHGDEEPAHLAALSPRAYKALRPSTVAEAQTGADRYGRLGPPDGPQLLIDAYDPQEYGGTGKRADWHAAAGLAQFYPRLVLAGGLTPTNVAEAVRTVGPWGVDVSSGVEAKPGQKDHEALRRFIAAAKRAAV